MEIHQLKYFLSTVSVGSFTGAAKTNLVSQPSLSVQIALLEDELGGVLFDRGRRGAKLTQRGERFLPHAQAVLGRLKLATDDLNSYDKLKVGRVTLGCLPITGAHLLPAVLKGFRRRYPDLLIELVEASSPGLAAELQAGGVELAILDEAGITAGLEHKALFSEPLDLAVPPGHALAKRKKVSLSSLANEPFIIMKPEHGFRRIVERAFREAGIQPKVVMESGEIETVQSMVSAGLGLALVPRMVRKPSGPSYVALASPTPRRTLSLAWRKGISLSPAAQGFKEHCLKTLQRGARTG